MGLHIFRILEVRKFWHVRILGVKKMRTFTRSQYLNLHTTKMGSIVLYRVDCNGVGVLRGKQEIPSKNPPKYQRG